MINRYQYTPLLLCFLMGSIHNIQASDGDNEDLIFQYQELSPENSPISNLSRRQPGTFSEKDSEDDESCDNTVVVNRAPSVGYTLFEDFDAPQNFNLDDSANHYANLLNGGSNGDQTSLNNVTNMLENFSNVMNQGDKGNFTEGIQHIAQNVINNSTRGNNPEMMNNLFHNVLSPMDTTQGQGSGGGNPKPTKENKVPNSEKLDPLNENDSTKKGGFSTAFKVAIAIAALAITSTIAFFIYTKGRDAKILGVKANKRDQRR